MQLIFHESVSDYDTYYLINRETDQQISVIIHNDLQKQKMVSGLISMDLKLLGRT